MSSRLTTYFRGGPNGQNIEVTQNVSVQTTGPSDRVVTRLFGHRSDTESNSGPQLAPNPFSMSLTSYIRSRNRIFGRPVRPTEEELTNSFFPPRTDPPPPIVDNPLRQLLLRGINQARSQSSNQTAEPPAESSSTDDNAQGSPDPKPEPSPESDNEQEAESEDTDAEQAHIEPKPEQEAELEPENAPENLQENPNNEEETARPNPAIVFGKSYLTIFLPTNKIYSYCEYIL